MESMRKHSRKKTMARRMSRRMVKTGLRRGLSALPLPRLETSRMPPLRRLPAEERFEGARCLPPFALSERNYYRCVKLPGKLNCTPFVRQVW